MNQYRAGVGVLSVFEKCPAIDLGVLPIGSTIAFYPHEIIVTKPDGAVMSIHAAPGSEHVHLAAEWWEV